MNVKIKEEYVSILQKRVDENDDFADVQSYVNYLVGQVVTKLKEKRNVNKE